jgi:hypothetical protein
MQTHKETIKKFGLYNDIIRYALDTEDTLTARIFFDKMKAELPEDDFNAALYYSIIYFAIDVDIPTARELFGRMQAKFPEDDFTEQLIGWQGHILDSSRNIFIGKTIPDFEFKNLDNENENISMQSLREKYILIDVWGT